MSEQGGSVPENNSGTTRAYSYDDGDDDSLSFLSDDAWFSITSRVQWHEACLYNFGARVLPESNDGHNYFGQTAR